MTRPSNDLDQRLLAAGRTLLDERGFGGLSVRAAARRARVNPGMFHYHFKTMRAFKRQLLQSLYEEFFRDFSLRQAEARGEARDRLIKALGYLGRFVRDHRQLGLSLLEEAVRGDPEVLDFLKANFGRHLAILRGLVDELKRGSGWGDWPPAAVMSFLMSSVGLPSLFVAGLRRAGAKRPYGEPLERVEEAVLTDAAIDRRARAAVRGLDRS
ncbi:MAG TPA: TetR/AcrR family transcriptional regulator [Elusimicrobiota bacterium]|nr:TetR/AcrR family transcriptional regulator [Elusimicrobiota bacterium]